MKGIVGILFLIACNCLFSQSAYKIYTWEEAKKLPVDSVFSISLEKMKLDSIPKELFNYIYLRQLNLGKNKLTELPNEIRKLSLLEELNLEKNEFVIFPKQICDLKSLKVLIFNRNDVVALPEEIGHLKQLEFLDIWATPIQKFPEAFVEMENLKKIDARGISHGKQFHEEWNEKLKNVRLLLDPPCNCSD